MLRSALDRLIVLGRFADFVLNVVAALPQALFRRTRETLNQFERVTWGGLPIASVAGLSVGLVTWLQTRRLLVEYGIEATLPSVLAVAVMVETGPLLASLLVAGRMGAGLAAELASMTLTEEIEARAILGADPVATLVAPRVLACAVALPLLTIVLDACAMLGALGAELGAGSLTIELFGARSLAYLRLIDLVPATLKTALFGMIVAIIACWTGLHADRSTESVGRAATRGVVGSMLAVFGANVLIVPWIQWMASVLSHS